MRLIVGLGNPGSEYDHTRHNIGFDALDKLAEYHQISIQQNKFSSLIGMGVIGDTRVCLLKPQTFMNLSGKAVQAAASYFNLSASDIIVIHDDLDLQFGQIKLKLGGGHGGHNGLRDIIKFLKTKDFERVRLGIGRPQHGDVINYVLGRFKRDEESDAEQLIYDAVKATELILAEGLAKAQLVFHT